MKIIGLTGGLGSGKSTVATFFAALGVPVYNSDTEAKLVMTTDLDLIKAIKKLLGAEAYTKDGILNRKYIANIVFSNTDVLEKLNNLVHPAVRRHFLDWTKKQISTYVIQESALIFENQNQSFYDQVILVTAPEEIRIKRALKRDNTNREQIVKRIRNQMEESVKIPLSHFVIENLQLKETQKTVKKLHNQLLKQWKTP